MTADAESIFLNVIVRWRFNKSSDKACSCTRPQWTSINLVLVCFETLCLLVLCSNLSLHTHHFKHVSCVMHLKCNFTGWSDMKKDSCCQTASGMSWYADSRDTNYQSVLLQNTRMLQFNSIDYEYKLNVALWTSIAITHFHSVTCCATLSYLWVTLPEEFTWIQLVMQKIKNYYFQFCLNVIENRSQRAAHVLSDKSLWSC